MSDFEKIINDLISVCMYFPKFNLISVEESTKDFILKFKIENLKYKITKDNLYEFADVIAMHPDKKIAASTDFFTVNFGFGETIDHCLFSTKALIAENQIVSSFWNENCLEAQKARDYYATKLKSGIGNNKDKIKRTLFYLAQSVKQVPKPEQQLSAFDNDYFDYISF